MGEQLEFAKLVTSRLQSAAVPHMMTGSMAMALYGIPRMTRDIDLVIECRPADADKVVGLFSTDCYIDRESVRAAVAARTSFNVIHTTWMIKADFIVRKDDVYREVEFGRRRVLAVEGVTLPVVAPEDLVLSKLLWSKQGESELQLRDARTIAEGVPELDWQYMETWAARLGIQELLQKVTGT